MNSFLKELKLFLLIKSNHYLKKIFKIHYLDDIHIKKERFSKKYRHADLDKKLTKERIKSVHLLLRKY